MPAARGIIYDRNKKIIADNGLGLGVFIVPQEATDLNSEIKRLAEILGVSESLLIRNFKRNYQAPFAPCELLQDISIKEVGIIEELKLDLPGVLIRQRPVRRYHYKDALAHVTGYIGEIDSEELEFLERYGYKTKDWVGKDGIERAADILIRGRNGGVQIQVDNKGRQAKVLNFKAPRNGRDIYLTVDAELQEFIWSMMKDKKGAAVFMDVNTGEVLALLSTPSYDPNNKVDSLLSSEEAPLLNRAIMGQYPPGSLFKVIVALAGLESGRLSAGTRFHCNGALQIGSSIFSCWKKDGHGYMDLENAIIESCNVYFYNFGIRLGVDNIVEFASQFGFGKKTGIELYGESSGFLPSRAWKRSWKGHGWYTGDTANLSIGQGYLLVTPLQVACAMASIANSGLIVKPHIIKSIGPINCKTIHFSELNPKTEISSRIKMNPENLEIVKRAMRGVVTKGNGTGFRAWSSLVSISAKTGTSQAGEGLRSHAWFSGFAPSSKPEISFVIFLEHGGSGGDEAAIIAKKAVEFWYRKYHGQEVR